MESCITNYTGQTAKEGILPLQLEKQKRNVRNEIRVKTLNREKAKKLLKH